MAHIKLCAYIAGALLCVLAVNAQSNNEKFLGLVTESTQTRVRATTRYSTTDQQVLSKMAGERAYKIQVAGQPENDFVESDESETLSRALTEAIDPRNPNRLVTLRNDQLDDFDANGVSNSRTVRNQLTRARPNMPFCVFDEPNQLSCDEQSLFREPSGRCNNLRERTFGMAGTPFRRLLPPRYEDGIGAVRLTTAFSNKPLPNPREISQGVTRTTVILDNLGFSAQIMQWGQFSAHEVTSIQEIDLTAVCCADQVFEAENPGVTPTAAQLEATRAEIRELRGDVCIPIERENDPSLGNVCMNQVRARAAPIENCAPAPRQQANTATHMMDGSAIYGSSTSAMERLRTRFNGQLKSQRIGGEELPPVNEEEECPTRTKCPFAAGDGRVNTTPNLASAHTIFIRKHNDLVDRLTRINRHWDDERLFQEARRIIIAIEQNIHYNEWLQHLLGDRLDKYGLRRSTSRQFLNIYDRNLHPGLINELATAGQRFGHSTINGFFTAGSQFLNLTEHFERPGLVYDVGISPCLGGLAVDRPWRFDRNFPAPMREELFRERLDIVTLNLNRGRDHGLRTYAEYRAFFGLSSPRTFNDLQATHPQNVIDDLERIYDDVRDVELYIGAITENKLPTGFLGPLFAEILGFGYRNLRNGDRLFFEGRGSGFSLAQVNNIRDYKYSKLICSTSNTNVARDAFRRTTPSNPAVSCSSLPDLNLELWRETPTTTPPPVCKWRNLRRNVCCQRERQVIRRCVGGPTCRAGVSRGCEGSEIVIEPCVCSIFDPFCTSVLCRHFRDLSGEVTTLAPIRRVGSECFTNGANPFDVIRVPCPPGIL